jgi:hypothetical protein
LALRRMQEHGPFLAGVVKRQGQLLHVPHDAEASQCIRMREGIGALRRSLSTRGLGADGKIQQRFRSLSGKVV